MSKTALSLSGPLPPARPVSLGPLQLPEEDENLSKMEEGQLVNTAVSKTITNIVGHSPTYAPCYFRATSAQICWCDSTLTSCSWWEHA